MNKNELIKSIAKETNLSKKKAKDALDAFSKSVNSILKAGDSVVLAGFGTFYKDKKGIRFKASEAMKRSIVEEKVVHFKTSKARKRVKRKTRK